MTLQAGKWICSIWRSRIAHNKKLIRFRGPDFDGVAGHIGFNWMVLIGRDRPYKEA